MNQQSPSNVTMTETLVPTVVVAWAVVVGADADHDGVVCVQFDGTVVAPMSGHTGHVVPMWHAAQPGQGWIIVGGAAALAAELEALGAVGYVVDTASDVPPTLLRHANAARLAAQANSVEMMAEVTVLRRELNSSLSALSPTHPILGLMPSATLGELAIERRPEVPQSSGGPALMVGRDPKSAVRADLEAEIVRLHAHIAAIENSRVARWTRLPLRIVRRMRSAVR